MLATVLFNPGSKTNGPLTPSLISRRPVPTKRDLRGGFFLWGLGGFSLALASRPCGDPIANFACFPSGDAWGKFYWRWKSAVFNLPPEGGTTKRNDGWDKLRLANETDFRKANGN